MAERLIAVKGLRGISSINLLRERAREEGEKGRRRSSRRHGAPVAVDHQRRETSSGVSMWSRAQAGALQFVVGRSKRVGKGRPGGIAVPFIGRGSEEKRR